MDRGLRREPGRSSLSPALRSSISGLPHARWVRPPGLLCSWGWRLKSHQTEQGDLDLVLFHLALHHTVNSMLVKFTSLSVRGVGILVDRPHSSRCGKDYKGLAETGEAFIFVAMPQLMAK